MGASRVDSRERCDFLLPTLLHCDSPEVSGANVEYMFPFASVVRCDQEKMLSSIGSTLVCSAITGDEAIPQSVDRRDPHRSPQSRALCRPRS